MHVHGSGRSNADPNPDDPELIDLDALAASEQGSEQANVA